MVAVLASVGCLDLISSAGPVSQRPRSAAGAELPRRGAAGARSGSRPAGRCSSGAPDRRADDGAREGGQPSGAKGRRRLRRLRGGSDPLRSGRGPRILRLRSGSVAKGAVRPRTVARYLPKSLRGGAHDDAVVSAWRAVQQHYGVDEGGWTRAEVCKLRSRVLRKLGAAKLLSEAGGLFKALAAEFPEFFAASQEPIQVWELSAPNGFWAEPSNVRQYLLWLMRKKGTPLHDAAGRLVPASMEKLYALQVAEVKAEHGGGLLAPWNGRISEAIRAAFPDFPWEEGRFHLAPPRQTRDEAEISSRLRELVDTLVDPERPETWSEITTAQVAKISRSALERYRNHPDGAVYALLMAMLPELARSTHPPRPQYWRLPREAWKDPNRVREVLLWLARSSGPVALGDAIPEVTVEQLPAGEHEEARKLYERLRPAQLRRWRPQQHVDGFDFFAAVAAAFPEFTWERSRFKGGLSAGESALRSVLQEQLSFDRLRFNKAAPDTVRNIRPLRYDVYSPRLGLAIEYHGEQHFLEAWDGAEQLRRTQALDEMKVRKSEEVGILVLVVAYDDWKQLDIPTLNAVLARELRAALTGSNQPRATAARAVVDRARTLSAEENTSLPPWLTRFL
jgi:hypothetical protein